MNEVINENVEPVELVHEGFDRDSDLDKTVEDVKAEPVESEVPSDQ